jgi:PPM family protein phosphatase
MTIAVFSFAVGAGAITQDAALAVALAGDGVLAVADGAGGRPGSEHAAQHAVAAMDARARSLRSRIDPLSFCSLLQSLDEELFRKNLGETTAIVCGIDADGFCGGASVGDAQAWAWSAAGAQVLTTKQKRKPLLGSGEAVVTPFFFELAPASGPWIVLLATDGLFNTTSSLVLCSTQLARVFHCKSLQHN